MKGKKLLSIFLIWGMLAQGCLAVGNKLLVSYAENETDEASDQSSATSESEESSEPIIDQYEWFDEYATSWQLSQQGKNQVQLTFFDNAGIWGADNNLLDDTPYNVVIVDKCKNTVLEDKDKKEFTKNKVIRLDTTSASWLYIIGGQSINQKLLNGLDLRVTVTDFKDKASVDTLKMLDGPKNVLSNFKNTPIVVCFATDQKLPLTTLVEIYLKDVQPGEYIPYCVYETEDGKCHFVKKDKIKIGKNKKIRTKFDQGCDFILVKESEAKSLKPYETN